MTTRPPTADPNNTQPDRNFDDLAQRFSRTIYATPRGQLRLLALSQDFADCAVPSGQTILDIGGGQGQFSLQLAQHGAEVSLLDLSEEMLALARDQFIAAGLPLTTQLGSLQQVDDFFPQQYPLVLNHAVLEWLEQPFDALPILVSKVAPGGWLSLMFYNLHGHQWRQIMNGRTHAPTAASERLRQQGNAPQHPLDPDAICQALQDLGMTIKRWRGIRCIHDHMHQKIRQRIGQDQVNQTDLEYGLKEPYRRLGRYVHLLCQKS
ncbi:rRNA methylase [Bacterioplanes sanyensis]|uniref:tRNA 5-carboxymethoxyuridine methyltransferase n=1 Tax=Bacterioplanes sanyensis TaxID=1249553 RepID=A0A222FK91_9GAMM|nr:methyltransferase domain-containing protein [Bacterioplanes sanyensis]ASP38811.1 rRNA methylase [Bacterioplanes sanyensis]